MTSCQIDRIALLDQKIRDAKRLLDDLKVHQLIEKKVEILLSRPSCNLFLSKNPRFKEMLSTCSFHEQYLVLALLALGQEHTIFQEAENLVNKTRYSQLIEHLTENEKFYEFLGGIVGYHLKVLQLMRKELAKEHCPVNEKFHAPPSLDMRHATDQVSMSIIDGIRLLDSIGEIYVVGGAGDRLHLENPKDKRPLPAACLRFCNKTLFEWLIQDLQAREYLYYNLFHRRITTPILLMTSKEKRNDEEIEAICENNAWFGRPKDSFFLLVQPLAPVIDIEGDWAVTKSFELVLKPGGHGVIWKLAKDLQGFDFFRKQAREFALIRQINNPLAGQDNGLLTLIGFGTKNKKTFGIIACPRMKHASEGMIVCHETMKEAYSTYAIANIEYTEISKVRVEQFDIQTENGESAFPANTNILFANIDSLQRASDKLPLPGSIVNMKQSVHTYKNGVVMTLQGARLESTMQNITDVLTIDSKKVHKTFHIKDFPTFVLLGDREKTISVAKKAFDLKSPKETPESCFYDLITCNLKMLVTACKFSMDPLCSFEEYLQNGPSMIFLYHPALGPLYSIIGQKIMHGRLHQGSELLLDIAHVHILDLDLEGSLVVRAHSIFGVVDQSTKLLQYSDSVGKVELINVKVKNKGLISSTKEYWKNEPKRHESLHIELEGNSQFYAENIEFDGNFNIVVPDGMKAYASQDEKGVISIVMKPLHAGNDWKWLYEIKDKASIALKKEGIKPS